MTVLSIAADLWRQAFARKNLGDKPVTAIVFSHSHADHFGGALGVASPQEVAERKIPVIASLNGTTDGGWLNYARQIQDAGADALVIGVPPQAAALAPDGVSVIEGPISGPAAFPFTLQALRVVASLGLGLPVIAAGGQFLANMEVRMKSDKPRKPPA